MIYIMDASAMLAFLRDEAGADVIETYLLELGSHSLTHSINLCEVFYDFVRAESEAQAQQAIADLQDIGVSERSDLDAAFWQEAGKLKAVHRRVSLANCLAMALTSRTGGSLVTSDHHELDPLAALGVCPIIFFR
jgi:PIN domain nuclease of toxin-antitoxin system